VDSIWAQPTDEALRYAEMGGRMNEYRVSFTIQGTIKVKAKDEESAIDLVSGMMLTNELATPARNVELDDHEADTAELVEE
jgi:hypothetical protein